MARPYPFHALALAAAFALAGPLAQAATPGVDAPPLPGPAVALKVPPVVVKTLDNRLTVIVARRAATPLVTMSVVVRTGAERDPADRAGLANIATTMLTRGTRRGGRTDVDTVEISRLAESMGGDLQATSGFGSSQLSMTVIAPRAPEALALLADLVRHPTFPGTEIERTLAEEGDDLRVRLSSPGTVAGMAARRAFWGDSPYGASETPDSIGRIASKDLVDFHGTWFVPANAAIVFAGDIDEATAMALVRRSFGDWGRAGGGVTAAPPAAAGRADGGAALARAPKSQAPALLSIDLGGVGQSGVAVAAPYAPLGSPDRYVAQVANAVLGGGYSARLNQEVRIKRGLAYGAGSRGDSQPAGGMMTARVQTDNLTAGQVVTLVRDEIARLGQAAPAADELAARQSTLVGEFGRELDTTAQLGALVGTQWVRGLPMDDLGRYTERVLAVTGEQVKAYAAATWTPGTLRVVVAGDASKSAEGLKPLMTEGASRAVKLADVDFAKATLAK
jgi:zinc protease